MRCALVTALLLVAPLPATALEGRFASADENVAVRIEETGEGMVAFRLQMPDPAANLELQLVPEEEEALLRQPDPPASWFAQLMGREPRRLPFDGRRLALGQRSSDAFRVTTLEVDAQGRPALRKVTVRETTTGALLERRAYGMDGLEIAPVIALERRP